MGGVGGRNKHFERERPTVLVQLYFSDFSEVRPPMGGAGGRDGRLEREASSALVQLGIDPCFPVPARQLLDTPGRPGAAEGHRERCSKRERGLPRERQTNKVLKGRLSLGGGRGVGCSNGGQRLPGVPPLCPRPSTAFPGASI